MRVTAVDNFPVDGYTDQSSFQRFNADRIQRIAFSAEQMLSYNSFLASTFSASSRPVLHRRIFSAAVRLAARSHKSSS